MFEAKTKEYFQGVCDQFLLPSSKVTVMVQLVFGKELFTIYNLFEAGSEHKVAFWAALGPGLPELHKTLGRGWGADLPYHRIFFKCVFKVCHSLHYFGVLRSKIFSRGFIL